MPHLLYTIFIESQLMNPYGVSKKLHYLLVGA